MLAEPHIAFCNGTHFLLVEHSKQCAVKPVLKRLLEGPEKVSWDRWSLNTGALQ